MAIKRIIIPSNNGGPLLAAMKQIPFFTENYSLPETYVSADGLTVSDKSTGDPLFKIQWSSSRWYIYIYKTDSSYIEKGLHSDSAFNSIWGCSNGAILTFWNGTGSKYAVIRFVKNTKGKLTVIASSELNDSSGDSNKYFVSSLYCASFGDSTNADNTFTISNSKHDQYEVVPMLTDCPSDEIVYTKDSGFLMYSDQSLTVKAVEINGTTYLVDGYFAIKDEEVSADG